MSWWKRSLAWQLIGFMLLALSIGQCLSFAYAWNERRNTLREAAQSELISRTATLAEVLDSMPTEMRRNVLLASATSYIRYWISDSDPRAGNTSDWHQRAIGYLSQPLSEILATDSTGEHSGLAPDPKSQDSSVTAWSNLDSPLWTVSRPASFLNFSNLDGVGLVTPLKGNLWLNAALYKPLTSDLWRAQSLLSIAVTALVLGVLGVFFANRIARPLRELTSSAEAIGRGEAIANIPEVGPDDIRRLCEAFNRMQSRLRRFVDDRTKMLAAIGHDLRTPLTTLRLRAEFIADEELQQKILATIDEMKTMTEATLSFAKGEAAVEDTRTVDLNALIESLCDDLAEIGHDVEFVEGDPLAYRCRPDGIKRAVRNLIENALRYGGHASVRLVSSPSAVDILVDDEGPGIPPAEIEQVFAPFYRLEQSRSRETGGVGLGLSIARAIIRHHGGDIVLSPNNPGLRAAVSLPRL
jgi:signal transduction histidine kinase